MVPKTFADKVEEWRQWQEDVEDSLDSVNPGMKMLLVEIDGETDMVDEDFRVWLIEVNSAPSMEYSTKVTEQLAQEALRDALKCVLDAKHLPPDAALSDGGGVRHRLRPRARRDVDTGKWRLLHVAPEEFRNRLDAADLTVCGSGLSASGKKRSK